MQKVGIAIEQWKLKVFKRNLENGNFSFTQGPGLTNDTLFLTVEIEDSQMNDLRKIVVDSQKECGKLR